VAFQRHDYEGVSCSGGEEVGSKALFQSIILNSPHALLQVMRNLQSKVSEAQATAVPELASAENFS
jgi:hypothetical protein